MLQFLQVATVTAVSRFYDHAWTQSWKHSCTIDISLLWLSRRLLSIHQAVLFHKRRRRSVAGATVLFGRGYWGRISVAVCRCGCGRGLGVRGYRHCLLFQTNFVRAQIAFAKVVVFLGSKCHYRKCAVFVCKVLTGAECNKFTPGNLDSEVSDGSVVALGSRFTFFSSLRLTLTGTSDWLPARLQLNYRTHHT